MKSDKRARGLDVQNTLTSSHFNLFTSLSSRSPRSSNCSPSSYNAFTLIEMLVVIVMVSFLLAASVTGIKRFATSLEYANSVNQVLSDVKMTQQLAETSSQTCKIEFKAGKNIYNMFKGTNLIKSLAAGSNIQFYGKSFFSFAPSGNTDVGGSGTLYLSGTAKAKKIVVSSRGRIRVE